MNTLQDKIAIVTGGGQGLGEALAHRLADEGAHVVVADITEPNARKRGRGHRRANGPPHAGACAWMSPTRTRWRAMVAQTRRRAWAGSTSWSPTPASSSPARSPSSTPTRWRQVIEVNLIGYFLVRQAPPPGDEGAEERRRSSRSTASRARRAVCKNSAYAASKFGGIGLTQSLALELAAARRARQRHLPRQPAGFAAVGG